MSVEHLKAVLNFKSPWCDGPGGMWVWNASNLKAQAALEVNLRRDVKYLLVYPGQTLLLDRQGIYHDSLTYEVRPPPEEKVRRTYRTKKLGGRFKCHSFFGRKDYFSTRDELQYLFFGSRDEAAPSSKVRSTNGLVVNGIRMTDDGFAKLNRNLRWPIAADDSLLDRDIDSYLLEFNMTPPTFHYDAICPIDGYVRTIPAESYWSLPQIAILDRQSTDKLYCIPMPDNYRRGNCHYPDMIHRLCPHCLMGIASKLLVHRRCIGV